METVNTNNFISTAKERLAGKDARRIAVFHAGITAAFALVVTLLQYGLELGIGNTGGLSGIGTVTILQTVQTVLQWANTLLAPFWNLGFAYVTLLWARDTYAKKEDLLTGFHRIGPCMGLLINKFVLGFCVVFLCANVCSVVYLMTPDGQQMQEMMLSFGSMDAYYSYMEALSQQELMAMGQSMMPLLILCGALSAVLLVPLLYRFRLAEYAIVNRKGVRAFPAMLISAHLLRRRCWKLFRLDLRLWWYYALKGLCLVLYYLDMLLPAVGISLPVTGDGMALAAYGLYLAALFAVDAAFRPRVQTSYAVVYETFMAAGPAPKRNVPVNPQNMPWDAQ